MKETFIVAVGGAVGSVCRYKFSSIVLSETINWRFPLGTFLVNVVGCPVIGILTGFTVKQDYFPSEIRLLLITGLIGGFTTFSAFGLETFFLIRRSEWIVATAYVTSSVALGLLSIWLGFIAIPNKG